MKFDFPCPHCGTMIVNIPEKLAGQRGRCLHCQKRVTIPAPAGMIAAQQPHGRDNAGGSPLPTSLEVAHSPEEELPEVIIEPVPSGRGEVPGQRSTRGGQKSREGRRHLARIAYCNRLSMASVMAVGVVMLLGLWRMFEPMLVSAEGVQSPSTRVLEHVVQGFAICAGMGLVLIFLLTLIEILRQLIELERSQQSDADRGSSSGITLSIS